MAKVTAVPEINDLVFIELKIPINTNSWRAVVARAYVDRVSQTQCVLVIFAEPSRMTMAVDLATMEYNREKDQWNVCLPKVERPEIESGTEV